jgi:uncharacterized protein (TIGR03790 family)
MTIKSVRVSLVGSLVALAGGVFSAQGSGTGDHAVLIIDPNDPVSVRLGHYYKNARGIPDRNVVYMAPGATNHALFRTVNLPALSGHIQNAGIADHADYVLIAPTPTFFVSAPGMITDNCFPVNRFSISAAYTTAFVLDDFVGGAASSLPNRFYSTSNTAVGFDSETTWFAGQPSSQTTARRYYIGGLIGYTGQRGNTPEEIITMIDRGTAVEGTRPDGVVFLMNHTDDPARNVRSPQFNAIQSVIVNSLQRPCEILAGKLPWGRRDGIGIVSGWSTTTLAGGNVSLVPGGFGDHLTSYAATFDIADQNKCSEWITQGASGTNGTVEEPCNYTGKFPHSRFHVWYLQGNTIGEAYLRSLSFTPFQNLLLGDALARPFAHVPVVSVTGVPGGEVSGTIEITPSGTTTLPRGVVTQFELMVDGVSRGTVAAGGRFTLDTSTLHDGWHDVRVIGYDNSPNKTAGRWIGSLTTRNLGRGATLSVGATDGLLTDTYNFVVGGSGLMVREIQLVQHGRVIGAVGDIGVISVAGRALGAGPSQVRARAVFVDGREAWSPPIAMNISTTAGSFTPAAPEAVSYLKRGEPGRALVVELPAIFKDDPVGSTYEVVAGPTKATVIGGSGAFRVLNPLPNVSGRDSMTFRVTTPSGVSGVARISLRWGADCPADFNRDGFVDFFDYDAFVGCFGGECGPGESPDFNEDGFADFFDFDQYVTAFEAGC